MKFFTLGCRLWDHLSKVSFDLVWRHWFFPGPCMALSIFACAGKEGIATPSHRSFRGYTIVSPYCTLAVRWRLDKVIARERPQSGSWHNIFRTEPSGLVASRRLSVHHPGLRALKGATAMPHWPTIAAWLVRARIRTSAVTGRLDYAKRDISTAPQTRPAPPARPDSDPVRRRRARRCARR